MKIFLCALAISLILEGMAFALFPEASRQAFAELAMAPAIFIRKLGVIAIICSIAILMLARLFS